MVELCGVAKMKINNKTITASAYIFGYFISILLLKYILYDNGFAFSNILLIAGLVYTRFHLYATESTRLQDGACLILFVLFDKSLLDVGNIFLLFGVACIREQFHEEFVMKEVASFICGLVYLLMGWFSVGRILVIHFLLLFYFFCIGYFFTVFMLKIFVEGVFDALTRKLNDWTNRTSTSSENEQTSDAKKEINSMSKTENNEYDYEK